MRATAANVVSAEKEKMIFLQKDDEDDHDHDQNHNHSSGGGSGGERGGAKKGIRKSRGSTIMEAGSRCSRVNGRGWRCCQPTLVGYSLCEHHLGKGRLRSMTIVRSRPSKVAPPSLPPPQLLNNEAKRVKLGVVKARSLSSLLGCQITTNVNHGNNSDDLKP